MNITMKEIAQRCGVSVKTVSNVVNNYPHVRPNMRKLVMDEVTATGYVPDESARRLKSGKRPRSSRLGIGIILRPDINKYDAPYHMLVLQGIEEAILEGGHMVAFVQSHHIFEDDPMLYNYCFNEDYLSGVISFAGSDACLFYDKMAKAFPVVNLGFKEKQSVDFVDVSMTKGVNLGLDYLLELGHRDIGYLGASEKNKKTSRRLSTFKRYLKKHNLNCNSEWIIETSEFSRDNGYAMAKDLTKKDKIPTAVFCASDEIAFGAYRAIQEAGLKIPDDISVMGFDNLPMSSMIYPPLTTVSVDQNALGRKALELLLQRIKNQTAPMKNKTINTTLKIRSSCVKPVRGSVNQ